jgi:hypothetical protein
MLFDQMAWSGEHLHDPSDELVEQAIELIAAGGTRLLEDGFVLGAPIHPVEHQAVEVGIEIRRRAKFSE